MAHADTVGLVLKGSLEHLECYLKLFPGDLGTWESQQRLYLPLGNDLFRKSVLNGRELTQNLGSFASLTSGPSNSPIFLSQSYSECNSLGG